MSGFGLSSEFSKKIVLKCGIVFLLMFFAMISVSNAQIGMAINSLAKKNQSFFQPTANPLPKRLEPNVLLIDYCVPAGKTECHWTGAQGNAFVYSFVVADDFQSSSDSARPLTLLVQEGVDSVSCNGAALTLEKYQWYGHSFLKADLSKIYKSGVNQIELKSKKSAPIFITGDFLLEPASKGFVIKRDWQFLFPNSFSKETMEQLYQFRTGTPGSITEENNPLKQKQMIWRLQGLPFYQGAVSYREIFEIAWPYDAEFYVWCPKFGDPDQGGSFYAKKVSFRINNRLAGLAEPKNGEPLEFVMTPWIKSRTNDVLITLYGDPELLFKVPANPPKVMPAGKDYKISGFGLIEPFYIIKKF